MPELLVSIQNFYLQEACQGTTSQNTSLDGFYDLEDVENITDLSQTVCMWFINEAYVRTHTNTNTHTHGQDVAS